MYIIFINAVYHFVMKKWEGQDCRDFCELKLCKEDCNSSCMHIVYCYSSTSLYSLWGWGTVYGSTPTPQFLYDLYTLRLCEPLQKHATHFDEVGIDVT